MDNTPKNRPPSVYLQVDLSDNVLAHRKCEVCQRYIPEDRIPFSGRVPRHCSPSCRTMKYDRRKRAEKKAREAA